MVLRLSIMTATMAGFALGFAALVHSETRTPPAWAASAGCFDQGAVCARPAGY